MAFRDLERSIYGDELLLAYHDKPHKYYIVKADGSRHTPKGVTTILDATLEKRGLMTWPLGLALSELFGFYDFTDAAGTHLKGITVEKGTLWDQESSILKRLTPEEGIELIGSAHTAWTRKRQKGTDIGSVVHDAIEHFVRGQPFDLKAAYLARLAEGTAPMITAEFEQEVLMADLAFSTFKIWWHAHHPKLLSSEEPVYSKAMDVAGTYDLLFEEHGQLILADIKTTNASRNELAAMPEGIGYQNFIQLGFYALCYEEMHPGETIDNLMILSCRKDGNFTALRITDLGLNVEDCKEVARSTCQTFRFIERTKRSLKARGEKLYEDA